MWQVGSELWCFSALLPVLCMHVSCTELVWSVPPWALPTIQQFKKKPAAVVPNAGVHPVPAQYASIAAAATKMFLMVQAPSSCQSKLAGFLPRRGFALNLRKAFEVR